MNNFITPCLNYSEQWAFRQQIQVFSEVIYQTSEMSEVCIQYALVHEKGSNCKKLMKPTNIIIFEEKYIKTSFGL